jgi:hypothetical protein
VETLDAGTTSYFTAAIDNTIGRAAFFTLPISFLLLLLYRSAVRRSMRRTAAGGKRPEAGQAAPEPRSAAPVAPVALVEGDPRSSGEAAAFLARRALAGPWWNLAVYAFAGSVLAAGMSGLYVLVGGAPQAWHELLILFLQNAWPIVLTIGLVRSLSWWTWAGILAVFWLALAGLVLLNPGPGDWSDRLLEGKAATANFGMSIFMLLILLRPIRAIGPMVFVLCLALFVGVLAVIHVLDDPALHEPYVAAISAWSLQLGVSTEALHRVLVIGLLCAAAVLGWLLQRGIGALYTRGIISDQSLTVDILWLIAAVSNGAQLGASGWGWLAAAIGMFAVYKLVVLAGLALRRRVVGSTGAPPRLLLLRVFARGRQRRTFFDAFTEPWRFAGPVQLIAGLDLAGSTIEPHEFLDFVGGRLSRRFIASEADLERRLAETSHVRDHDGRYRVADFFCQDDTWRSVLRRLVGDSDAVLMDLRGFGPASKGCVFEIEELLMVVPLGRIVLVVDKSTDKTFLQRTLEKGIAGLPEGAANAGASAVTVYPLGSWRDVRQLVGAVATAASVLGKARREEARA